MAPSQDPLRDLLELATVHGFYVDLLQRTAGHPVPIPRQPVQGDRVTQSLTTLRNWIDILDMAITPLTLRDALKLLGRGDALEALLRYYVLKNSHRDSDRDKTDFVASYLYRHPAEWRQRKISALTESDDAATLSIAKAQEFEEELANILAGTEIAALPQEHQQLLREFEFLYHEIEDLRHFDALMDSGILQRVREMKAAFGQSFYHPRVLANVAVYNTFFGQHFDKLFAQAAEQIKTFAAKTQEEGGSILSRVEGDVTVKNLAEVEEQKILKAEYGTAQEHFRKVSKFKKAVDKRRSGRPAAAPVAVAAPAATATPAAAPAAAAAAAPSTTFPAGVEPAFTAASQQAAAPAAAGMEPGKIRTVLESIRNFVKVAERGADNIVPLRGGNVVLTPAEVEAYRSDFGQEKSFRADQANFYMDEVALHTRMMHELAEYKAKRSSAYLWKPHADSLTYLLTASAKCIESGKGLLAMAEQRGLGDKVKSLSGSMDKLRAQMQYVAKALQG